MTDQDAAMVAEQRLYAQVQQMEDAQRRADARMERLEGRLGAVEASQHKVDEIANHVLLLKTAILGDDHDPGSGLVAQFRAHMKFEVAEHAYVPLVVAVLSAAGGWLIGGGGGLLHKGVGG